MLSASCALARGGVQRDAAAVGLPFLVSINQSLNQSSIPERQHKKYSR